LIQESFESAVALFDVAIEAQPDLYEAHLHKAIALGKLG
jgi:hypothetical protein